MYFRGNRRFENFLLADLFTNFLPNKFMFDTYCPVCSPADELFRIRHLWQLCDIFFVLSSIIKDFSVHARLFNVKVQFLLKIFHRHLSALWRINNFKTISFKKIILFNKNEIDLFKPFSRPWRLINDLFFSFHRKHPRSNYNCYKTTQR